VLPKNEFIYCPMRYHAGAWERDESSVPVASFRVICVEMFANGQEGIFKEPKSKA